MGLINGDSNPHSFPMTPTAAVFFGEAFHRNTTLSFIIQGQPITHSTTVVYRRQWRDAVDEISAANFNLFSSSWKSVFSWETDWFNVYWASRAG